MKRESGLVIFSVVVAVAIIAGIVVSALLYMLMSYTNLNRMESNSERLRYVYESAKSRGWYEIVSNPQVYETIANGEDYVINDFDAEGVLVDILIGPDNDGDGVFDITVVPKDAQTGN